MNLYTALVHAHLLRPLDVALADTLRRLAPGRRAGLACAE